MSDIVKFLEARLAEDEAIAMKAGGSEAEWLYRTEYDNETGNEVVWANSRAEDTFGGSGKPFVTYRRHVTMDHEGCLPAVDEDDGTHIARHDPARVLREVSAKRILMATIRRRIEQGWGYHDNEDALADDLAPLAIIYSDHPDYQHKWSFRN